MIKILIMILAFGGRGTLQDYVESGNYAFETYTDEGKNEDAETFCNDKGGWVAEPTNAELNSALEGIVEPSTQYWIGLKFISSVWMWEQDGSVVGTKSGTTDCTDGYCNWYDTDGDNPGEDYAAIIPSGKWIDIGNANPFRFACQYGCYDTCKNGGTCTSSTDAPYYSCSCPNDYYGKSCESTLQDSVAFGSYVFKTFTGVGKYGDANSLCRNDGGWIAEPTNADLNNALTGILVSGATYWIGLKFDGSVWKWEQDGTAIGSKNESSCPNSSDSCTCTEGYCNWWSSNGDNLDEDYAAITKSGKWIDIANETPIQFACQYACNCQNGGTCNPLDIAPHYTCDCPSALAGSNCEFCITGTCQNGGTCILSDTGPNYYTCLCTAAYHGANCEYDYCESDSCLNGGTCNLSETTANHYECACTNSYYESNCENDYCESDPCDNGGTCSPSKVTANHYNCTCVAGYDGMNCENHYCDSNPCENGGTCSPSNTAPNYYTCSCQPGYVGERCESSGIPIIHNATGIPCSAEGKISVRWSPGEGSMDKEHKIQAIPVSADDLRNETVVSPPEGTTPTTIENLTSFAEYTINITACPGGDCFSELSASTTAMTDVGLPGPVQEPKVTQDGENAKCKITWLLPLRASINDIVEFKVTVIGTLSYQSPEGGLRTETSDFYVTPPELKYSLSPVPNRKYNFELSAETCAGIGESITAEGDCTSGYAAPYVVSPPTIADGDPAITREAELFLPSEDNGPISCLFVILTTGTIQKIEEQIFDINDLRGVSAVASDNKFPPDGTEYLALAIPRENFTANSIRVVLGDENETKCDVNEIHEKASNSFYTARNWELKTETAYSVYVASSTPVSESTADFKASRIVTFDNGEIVNADQNLWIIGAVLGPLVIIAIVGAAFMYTRRSKENSNQSSPDGAYETPYQDSDLQDQPSGYDNVTLTKDDADTDKAYETPYQISELRDRPSGYENVTLTKDDEDQNHYSEIPAVSYANIHQEKKK